MVAALGVYVRIGIHLIAEHNILGRNRFSVRPYGVVIQFKCYRAGILIHAPGFGKTSLIRSVCVGLCQTIVNLIADHTGIVAGSIKRHHGIPCGADRSRDHLLTRCRPLCRGGFSRCLSGSGISCCRRTIVSTLAAAGAQPQYHGPRHDDGCQSCYFTLTFSHRVLLLCVDITTCIKF